MRSRALSNRPFRAQRIKESRWVHSQFVVEEGKESNVSGTMLCELRARMGAAVGMGIPPILSLRKSEN